MTNIEETRLSKANSSRPLLSIVIPTRNRQEYAASAIRCALAIPSNDIEIVVQDCSDDELLSSLIVPERLDERLSYQYERPPVNMSKNWHRAISRASGEYVCVIGDDDGVNPEIVQAAAWAKSRNLDCLAAKNTVNYLWPGNGAPSTLFAEAPDGCLKISDFRGILTEVDGEAELRKLVRDGGVYYLKFNLPKLYHGLVHRRCLEAIREKVGAYCEGLSPDIFPSLAIACLAPRMAVTDYPLTIPGACKASNSIVVAAIKRHSKRLEDAQDFRDTAEYNWSELVPRLYTAETVWADSGVAALLAMGRNDLVCHLNLPKLAAYCIGANRGISIPVLRGLIVGLRASGKSPVLGILAFTRSLITGPGVKFTRRVWNRLLIILGIRSVHRINNLTNMVEASDALTRYLTNTGRSFADCAGAANVEVRTSETSICH